MGKDPVEWPPSSEGGSRSDQLEVKLLLKLLGGLPNGTWVDLSRPQLKPSVADIYPLFVFLYALLVASGTFTNLAMIYNIIRGGLYKDQTYCYFINLAIADLVKCIFVLPVSLAILLLQNWIFGGFLCYFLPMLQDIPMHVSTLTLLLIAWDRQRLLNDPLKPRIPAFVCATGSWLTAICIVLPYPIYTTYIDLQQYFPQFHGVGLCAINLLGDMQDYMRGLFIAMYASPLAVTGYLYVRMSRELEFQEGPLPVMMYEGRSRPSTTSSTDCRSGSGRSATNEAPYRFRSPQVNYDLYEAELDVSKEKRTNKYLAIITTVFGTCLSPLMSLRVARLALTETYENTGHFDITYMMFVWIAFLPTCTTPALYAAWRMSRLAKERLRGYLRLSRRGRSDRRQHSVGEVSEETECGMMGGPCSRGGSSSSRGPATGYRPHETRRATTTTSISDDNISTTT